MSLTSKLLLYYAFLMLSMSGFAQIIPSGTIKPVPFTSVHVTDQFWAPRIKINHDITIPIAIQKCYETGRVDNFLFAAKVKHGAFCTEYPFDDSDIYKIIEGAAYSLQTFPDKKLDARIDTLIDYIIGAQETDGYLYTNRTIDSTHLHPWAGKKRWEKDPDGSHELYNSGHLYEAASAHYLATGKRTLLDVAIKNADLVVKDFLIEGMKYYPGHQVIEMGLVKLYRVTQNPNYLKLAQYMLDIRYGGDEYNQAHKKVTEQDQIVGHAVRATYMYSGMADVAALTGNKAYTDATDRIWNDLIKTKYYITGGIGSGGDNEGFDEPYFLPNMSAYCETCASIGNVFWNQRLFQLHGEAKYFDILERTLYNALLSGVSLSGDLFFYPNPLESRGQHARSPWFGCACCPSNICRFIPSVPGYVYAYDNQNIYVNLYMANQAKFTDGQEKTIEIEQKTDYPWSGDIELTVNPSSQNAFGIALRIPGWAGNESVPSDLYRFTEQFATAFQLNVNGKPAKYQLINGYAVISSTWKKGDKINLSLPMDVKKIIANDKVESDRNRLSLQRGPFVYCLEGADQPNGHSTNILIDKSAQITSQKEVNLLNGITTLKGNAQALEESTSGKNRSIPIHFTAIPYYAWANRGAGEMLVWLPYAESAARPLPLPTIATESLLTASTETKSLNAIRDHDIPSNSNDHSISYYHWWPKKNSTEWIQYTFSEEKTISTSSVYWFDDGPWGGCRIPAGWKVLYLSGNEWLPVKTEQAPEILKDKLNTVSFVPVKTKAVRLEVTLPADNASGIYEWLVK